MRAINQLVQLGPTLKEYKVPEDGEGGVPRSFLGALGWATASRELAFHFHWPRRRYLANRPGTDARLLTRW